MEYGKKYLVTLNKIGDKMKVLKEGHLYELKSMELTNPQQVQFIEKEKINDEFRTINDGTTNEEVLEMLIDRIYFLQNKLSCRENSIVITHLEEALMWLMKRTKDRIKRNVENTPMT